jgi:hypothetical protein
MYFLFGDVGSNDCKGDMMPIVHNTPFVRQNPEDDPRYKRFTVRLNLEEQAWLKEDMKFLKQEKDSTALKQLAMIGHFVIHEDLTGKILKVVLENKRKNDRLGIPDEDATF